MTRTDFLTAFGYWNVPLHFFEGPFYVRIPASDDQGPLDRTLVTVLVGTTKQARLLDFRSRTTCALP